MHCLLKKLFCVIKRQRVIHIVYTYIYTLHTRNYLLSVGLYSRDYLTHNF